MVDPTAPPADLTDESGQPDAPVAGPPPTAAAWPDMTSAPTGPPGDGRTPRAGAAGTAVR
ncbi:hypothetical protein ACWCHM_31135 [Micromonospora sp. SCSIO 07396]